jgi:glycosyltransferase involved in cell wall biosynthesis
VVLSRQTGLLVPARDPAALAEAIATLVRDADLRERCGANARRLVMARFGAEAIHRQTLALYRDLMSEGGREPRVTSVAGA